MTAEVAVLNKSAVALAADSAMSVGDTGKTYPTNKLFALTKHHPVGVMVYNNADFMGVPWETIIKLYRQRLSRSYKPTVKEYAEDFLRYVGNDKICTDAQRLRNLLRIAEDYFRSVAREALRRADAGEYDVSASVRLVVAEQSAALAAVDSTATMQRVDVSTLIRTHGDAINRVIDQVFRDHGLDDTTREMMHEILATFVQSTLMSTGRSGLVFAGFGEDEMMPSLVEVVTDGSVGGVVKTATRNTFDLDRTGTHTVVKAFAQSEMVGRFMEGIDRTLFRYLESYFEARLTKVARDLLESSAGQDGVLTDEQLATLRGVVHSEADGFRQATTTYCEHLFVRPILWIVAHLPKEELANMAEALVSLTSVKRRVSMEEESVGGPVDVAVISKGDGFIWIRRKHYFDPVLNRDYLARQVPPHPAAQGE